MTGTERDIAAYFRENNAPPEPGETRRTYDCPDCGADLTPEHCMGMFDIECGTEGGPLDWHKYRCEASPSGQGYCICPCRDCSPSCDCWRDADGD